MLSLDTNVVVDILRRRPSVTARLAAAVGAAEDLRLSSVVVHELHFGALRSARPDFQRQLIEAFLPLVVVDEWSADDAVAAAEVRHHLAIAGRTIGAMDLLIAGQCLSRGYRLVTANVREFERVPGLELIDWSD